MAQEEQIKQLKTVFTVLVKNLIAPSFNLSEGGATKKILARFIDYIEKEFGDVAEERLVDVCVFIAYIHRGKLYTPASMFSKTNLKRYADGKRGWRFYENEWLATKGLSRSDLVKKIANRKKHPLSEFIYMPSEECRKLRLHGTKAGFLMCQSSTLGWSPLSEACKTCPFTDACQIFTKESYPELFRIRLEYATHTNQHSSD